MTAHETWQVENLRRSIVMLTPGQSALTREDALDLLEQLQRTQRDLAGLRAGLESLLATDDQAA